MSAWLTPFGGLAFLGFLVAIHWSYFRSNFSGDGRVTIRLPLTLDTGAKRLLLRPAAQSHVVAGSLPSIRGREGAIQAQLDDFAPLLAGSVPRLDPMSLPQTPAPLAPVTGNGPVDRLIINDAHLLLDGIVTETELVCWGDVDIAAGSVIGACMKVRGNMRVGANVTFLGTVVVNGNISAGENCVFLFDVVSKGKVSIGIGARLGSSTSELAMPMERRRITDQIPLEIEALLSSQYEMRYE
ncbi:hypothetical protein JQ543_16250 [Bradyrhizobium diazoefficiens]|nr:hypothetical protein [Bradyrhizobium diazoefficiens]MBR0849306.1 hypothetical protein [Bradyrhizobium diazoefficiens]